MNPTIKHSNLFILFLAVLLTAVSCTASKKVVYLNDLTTGDSVAIRTAQIAFETPIQRNDLLWITVGGSNATDLPALNSAIGMPGTGVNMNMGNTSGANIGYLVEADGSIKLPYLGKVQAQGLSRQALEGYLTNQFKDYTKNPVVNVRFLNNYVTVMGEVYRPGKIPMTTERITILEALGSAGDLTDYAKRENVLIVREINGVRNIERINLLSKSLFSSPYFYLRNNDVVYVEPVRVKFISRSGIPQYLSVAAVGLSLLITIINVTK